MQLVDIYHVVNSIITTIYNNWPEFFKCFIWIGVKVKETVQGIGKLKTRSKQMVQMVLWM